jgi:hypothetical protein
MSSAQSTQTWPLPGIQGVRIMAVESLPASLAGAIRLGPGLEAKPGAVLISVPQIARYLVTNGVAIEVAPMPRADRAAIELFLDQVARAAIIHERGELPFISTTIVSPSGKCVALCGDTGVGKSAVAAALTKRGWLLVGEGITRLVLDGDDVLAVPGHDALRLWRDSCEQLEIDWAGLHRTRPGFEKFYVPVATSPAPVRVTSVIRLRPDPKIFGPTPEVSSRKLLDDYTYKSQLAGALGQTARFEEILRVLTGQCSFAFVDGAHSASLDTMADRVEEAAA